MLKPCIFCHYLVPSSFHLLRNRKCTLPRNRVDSSSIYDNFCPIGWSVISWNEVNTNFVLQSALLPGGVQWFLANHASERDFLTSCCDEILTCIVENRLRFWGPVSIHVKSTSEWRVDTVTPAQQIRHRYAAASTSFPRDGQVKLWSTFLLLWPWWWLWWWWWWCPWKWVVAEETKFFLLNFVKYLWVCVPKEVRPSVERHFSAS